MHISLINCINSFFLCFFIIIFFVLSIKQLASCVLNCFFDELVEGQGIKATCEDEAWRLDYKLWGRHVFGRDTTASVCCRILSSCLFNILHAFLLSTHTHMTQQNQHFLYYCWELSFNNICQISRVSTERRLSNIVMDDIYFLHIQV